LPDPDLLLGEALGSDTERALAASRALFRDVIEPLSDSFDPAAVEEYIGIFRRALALYDPTLDAAGLTARYRRVRGSRRFAGDPAEARTVFVLSRVTIGADVAVTSAVLDAARRVFPLAEVVFVGPAKNHEVFAAGTGIGHVAASYARSATLRDRLDASFRLRQLLDRPGAVVIDPDSRLSQLGLVPVCAEDAYYFFESRSAGGGTSASLTELTVRWLAETFDVRDARPFVAPVGGIGFDAAGCATVSLGTGENSAKGLGADFEAGLLRGLAERGWSVVADKGAGGEEAERVERAISAAGGAPGQIRTWLGAFAPFAAAIARSRLYIGYDSAGQHVAAVAGVPLVTVFHGYPGARFLQRWRPTGPGPSRVIEGNSRPVSAVLDEALAGAGNLAPR
jgi:hypothetical protein